jgi:hypothetical protein
MKVAVHFAGMLLLVLAAPSHAVLVTIDADDYAVGTDLSNASSGLTLSAFSWAGGMFDPAVSTPTSSAIFAAMCSTGSGDTFCNLFDGPQVFSGGSMYGQSPTVLFAQVNNAYHALRLMNEERTEYVSAFNVLRVDFDSPTSLAQVVLGAGGWGSSWVAAFGADGQPVANCIGFTSCAQILTPEQYGVQRLTVDTDVSNIAFIIAGGGDNYSRIKSVGFDVPEPATFGLFALGLLGIAAARKRFALP